MNKDKLVGELKRMMNYRYVDTCDTCKHNRPVSETERMCKLNPALPFPLLR
jgi:hypothetical protein